MDNFLKILTLFSGSIGISRSSYLFTVFCGRLSAPAVTFIDAIVDGSLLNTSRFNFTMYADTFNGCVLYCIDSGKNQFGIEVTGGSTNERNIRLNFNRISKDVPLVEICGCDPCGKRWMTFDMQMNKSVIIVTCNRRKPEVLNINTINFNRDESNDDTLNPIPMKIANMSGKVYIMMGNVGPYVGEGNVTVYSKKTHSQGCVDTFYFRDRYITLAGDAPNLRTRCPKICNNATCNKGSCQQISTDRVSCDCSLTALNGKYCEKMLTFYEKGANNSYTIKSGANRTRIKMTWQQLLPKTYCLLEIIGSVDRTLVSLSAGNIQMNGATVSTYRVDGVNFMTVTIGNNFLIIKSNSNETKVPFALDDALLLNVGTSHKSGACETFEGTYDLDIQSSGAPELKSPITDISSKHRSGTQKNTDNKVKSGDSNMWYYICVPITVLFIVLVVIVIALHKISRKEMRHHVAQLIATHRTSIERETVALTVIGVYGKVEDNDNYDYIEYPAVYKS